MDFLDVEYNLAIFRQPRFSRLDMVIEGTRAVMFFPNHHGDLSAP